MAKQIRILTPQTTDGTTVAYDENDKIIFKETIAPESARRHFESLNGHLPEHLRHRITDVKDEKATAAPAEKKTPAVPKPKKNGETTEAATNGEGQGAAGAGDGSSQA